MPVRVSLRTQVNASKIRRETHNGREHIVIPSYTLPANVIMNGGLYPAAEIDKHYAGLEGTLAPLGHPYVDGQPISAFAPEAINAYHAGAYNRNVKKSGNRVYCEKWVDVEVAQRTDKGRALIERVSAIDRGEDVPPIHTSVALFLHQDPAPEGAQGYSWVARIEAIDHDAILLDEVGAATPEQGVGLLVNTADAVTLAGNESDAMIGETYRQREQRLDRAARVAFVESGQSEYVWIGDFTDSQVIVVRDGGTARVYDYEVSDGVTVIRGDGREVVRQESWVTTAVNALKRFFTHQARPDNQQQEGTDMPITKDDRAEIVRDLTPVINDSITAALAPITEGLTSLQANQEALAEAVTANQRAQEKTMRDAVAAKYGEVVANSLTGDALEGLYKTLDPAAPVGDQAGPKGNSQETGAPDPTTYLPE